MDLQFTSVIEECECKPANIPGEPKLSTIPYVCECPDDNEEEEPTGELGILMENGDYLITENNDYVIQE